MLWAVASDDGNKTPRYINEKGETVEARTPREYIEQTNNTIQEAIDSGEFNPDMTWRQLFDQEVFPQLKPYAEKRGLMDKTIGEPTFLVGASNTSNTLIAYMTGSMTWGKESPAGEHLDIRYGDNPATAENERGSFIHQNDPVLNSSMLIETDAGSGKFVTPSEFYEYAKQNGFPHSDSQHAYGAPRDGGSRTHTGLDFRTRNGSTIKFLDATVLKTIYGTVNGDVQVVKLRDGTIVEMLHGKAVN
jgi:hypothetical protein